MRWLDGHNGHEFEQTPGVDDGQGSLAYCSPWDCKKSDMTEQLNRTDSSEMSYIKKKQKLEIFVKTSNVWFSRGELDSHSYPEYSLEGLMLKLKH